MGRKNYLEIIFIFTFFKGGISPLFCQNLILNPSFEEIDSCVNWMLTNQYNLPLGWRTHNCGTPDLFTTCFF
jgi:hypothetical protein